MSKTAKGQKSNYYCGGGGDGGGNLGCQESGLISRDVLDGEHALRDIQLQ